MNGRVLLALTLAIGAIASPSPAQTSSGTSAAEAQAADALNKAVAEKKKKNIPPPTNAKPILRLATPAELERLYLDGRITAKDYQRKLAEFKAAQTAPAPIDAQTQAVDALKKDAQTIAAQEAAARQAASKARLPVAVTPSPKPAAPPDDTAVETKAFTDVEKKFDQLIEKKNSREKTAGAPAATPEPKTKREKLDVLLRQLVDGKVTEADYEKQRAKIIAGPE